MKAAFHTYSTAFRNPGGGEVQLFKTKEYLEKLGVLVKLFDPAADDIGQFDVLHVFSSVPECLDLIVAAKKKNVPVVTSTVLWSDWRMALGAPSLSEKLSRLTHQAAKWLCPVYPSGRRRVLLNSDLLLPNSDMEKKQIARYFAISPQKIHVVPNAVDARFAGADPALARKTWGPEPFILCVGRIEPRKNQLNLIRALSKSKPRLLILGDGVAGYEGYERLCRQEGRDFAEFHPALPHEDPLLRSAYAACSLFVAPGWFETPSLAALEAGLAGARVLVTQGGSTREYFGRFADYLDPSNPRQIAKAVQMALTKPADPQLGRLIRERFTWQACARETLRAYSIAQSLRR